MSVDITMIGDEEVMKLFKQLPDNLQKKFARQAMRKEAKKVMAKVVAATPVHSGRLKESWKLKALKRNRKRIGLYIESGTRSELGVAAFYRGYYPAHIELGTRKRAAKPFLRPILRATSESTKQNIGRLIGKAIEKEANAKLRK